LKVSPFIFGFLTAIAFPYLFSPPAILKVISLKIERTSLSNSVSGILVYTSTNANNKIINISNKLQKTTLFMGMASIQTLKKKSGKAIQNMFLKNFAHMQY